METTKMTYFVPDEMCELAGISGRFLSSNTFSVFPSQSLKAMERNPIEYPSTTQAKLFHIKPEVILFHPILRRLLNETSGIFVQLQKTKGSTLSSSEILHFSNQYRSVIRACLENLKEEVMRTSGSERNELQNFVTIFYSIECVFHLCEILYINTNVGNILGTRLLDWVRFHIPKYERAASQMLQTFDGTGIECMEIYWPTVIGCLLQGRITEVRLLLGLHSNAGTRAFKAADASFKTMPTHAMLAGDITITEFNIRRKHWLLDTQAKIDMQVFSVEPQINFMMHLLVGHESAWDEVIKHCEVWYEFLAAWIFYTEPTLKTFELNRYARRCISRMGVPMKHIDVILLAALETDVEFLKQIQNMNDNGWFITHLVDLLHHSQQLDLWRTHETTSAHLRESFIVEYGTLLMSHSSLWQIGLCYLDNCPIYGMPTIEILLPRLAWTENKTSKLIREASKRRLFAVCRSLSKMQCQKALQINRPGSALVWAIKAKDPEFINNLVNRFLRHYKATSVLPNQDLLNNLGGCIFACDSLIFLAKYYEFRRHMEHERYPEASSIIVGLIGSKFTPRFFCDVILSETLRLLESGKSTIDKNSTLVVLNYLDDKDDQIELKEKLTMLRMALARNVANVLTEEIII